jgi:hypothetical protein
MKKSYNFRLDPKLIEEVDKIEGNRTNVVTNALHKYIDCSNESSYNVDLSYINHLEDEVKYLRSQVNGLMLARIPLLSKIKMKLLEDRV